MGQAFADYAPQPNDVVGVGGDTPQYAVDFLINGDTKGHLGFDESTGVNRVVPFDATADGNGRQAYTSNTTTGANSTLLSPTDVLRAGDNPVQRAAEQRRGPERAALPTSAAAQSGDDQLRRQCHRTIPRQWGARRSGLRQVRHRRDQDRRRLGPETNAPAGLSATDLANIYDGTWTTWGQVATAAATSSGDTIIPEIPPSTSSIYSKFIAALVAAVPSFSVDSAVVKTVEQNDPTTITGASNSADAIVPFSAARLNLWNKGYFYSPRRCSLVPPVRSRPGVSLLSGTSPDMVGASLNIAISDYFVCRANDTSSAQRPYQPGGTLNWVQDPLLQHERNALHLHRPEGQTLIAASGVTPVADTRAPDGIPMTTD